MSAYIVEKATVDEIVGASIGFGLVHFDTADIAGQILYDANLESVTYQTGIKGVEIPAPYTYKPQGSTIGQQARSLVSLMKQCVGHPAWQSWQAREMCVALAVAFLSEIPGVADAVER